MSNIRRQASQRCVLPLSPVTRMLRLRVALACASALCCGATAEAASSPAAYAEPTAESEARLGEARLRDRLAFWPFTKPRSRAIYDSAGQHVTPHPAVARIIVPERRAVAYGSGTLVDVREQFGLVVTNWHVVRDSEGVVEVVFPSGFRSQARPLKVDSNWDLAALVIWRPPIDPVQVAAQPPRPGDLLTIHGYGQGHYRVATGRCTTYYAPKQNFPMEMVELDVEARQGDSGGPIFNQRGELAGVLFGAGQGSTLGSYAPRVSNFLATLAPDIGQVREQAQVAVADRPAPNVSAAESARTDAAPPAAARSNETEIAELPGAQLVDTKYPSAAWSSPQAVSQTSAESPKPVSDSGRKSEPAAGTSPLSETAEEPVSWYERIKSALAVVGLAAVVLRLVKAIG